ncbi:twisted gastrulation protein homolog 1-A-like [Biomphalaria glabrata]|uniref:Twisted gastrulation protein homolog 1-A-like n=2 Tax=Biomphalaria TaxID=6525 RepID=A0A9U8EJW2_BIOGL|nr:twisted gastrulation protein homolog 1-A-like [Biomphalaria glabrata]
MLLKAIVFCVTVLTVTYVSDACNEAVCAPLVSKCMLIKCCDCEMTEGNCSCCKNCSVCLSKLYTECCSCVGMCPTPNPEDEMTKSSTVEDITDPIPHLFKVLTDEEDYEQRWTTFTYAVDLDKLLQKSNPKNNLHIISDVKGDKLSSDKKAGKEVVLGIQNCTVAFFSDCMPMTKCKASCKSMGASKFRWFHSNGCCQCVGSTCYDYGLNEPKCLKCLSDEEEQPHNAKGHRIHKSESAVGN